MRGGTIREASGTAVAFDVPLAGVVSVSFQNRHSIFPSRNHRLRYFSAAVAVRFARSDEDGGDLTRGETKRCAKSRYTKRMPVGVQSCLSLAERSPIYLVQSAGLALGIDSDPENGW
jgi:hypothetical protein